MISVPVLIILSICFFIDISDIRVFIDIIYINYVDIIQNINWYSSDTIDITSYYYVSIECQLIFLRYIFWNFGSRHFLKGDFIHNSWYHWYQWKYWYHWYQRKKKWYQFEKCQFDINSIDNHVIDTKTDISLTDTSISWSLDVSSADKMSPIDVSDFD